MTDPYNSGTVQAGIIPLDDSMVTTLQELPGDRVVRNLGLVRGIVVR